MSILNGMVAGAVGGIAGGMVMSGFMMMGKKTGMIEEPMPLTVEHKLEARAGVADKTSPQQEQALATAEHMMISAAYGAGYGALKASQDVSAIPFGPLYGLGVYALNLGALGPGMALTPAPWQEEPMTVGRRVMMHAVYGVVTALVTEKVLERLESDGHEAWAPPPPTPLSPYYYPAP